MTLPDPQLRKLRTVITESLRVQRGGSKRIPYIDVTNALADACAKQNHAIFGRRGCGKTLLLHEAAEQLGDVSNVVVYLNCEDFKRHSFPNVIIEIVDALCKVLDKRFGGFGSLKKRRIRKKLKVLRKLLAQFRIEPDQREVEVRESSERESAGQSSVSGSVVVRPVSLTVAAGAVERQRSSLEQSYKIREDKVHDLDRWLPELKAALSQVLELDGSPIAVFVQLDDFYHLRRPDQPFVMDFVHRLCKDLPIYFKVATLRHASVLYADRGGQPIGAQERHDYQPINVDFTLADLPKTREQNRQILHEFARLADVQPAQLDGLFKGDGFNRLILAGGGVPRDCLSLFLEVLDNVQPGTGDGRIGKDDIRILSRANFERRIEELKQDSEGGEQAVLIRGIYVIRSFCLKRESNVFMVPEQMMQQEDLIRDLVYRLLDYRIIHNAGSALTHKSRSGTYQALAVDIGCYAHLRKLAGKFFETDLGSATAKESMRSAPILDATVLDSLWQESPEDPEEALRRQDEEEA